MNQVDTNAPTRNSAAKPVVNRRSPQTHRRRRHTQRTPAAAEHRVSQQDHQPYDQGAEDRYSEQHEVSGVVLLPGQRGGQHQTERGHHQRISRHPPTL